ncbi:MAG: iron ABC transporter permease [Pseudomonadota bacterium]
MSAAALGDDRLQRARLAHLGLASALSIMFIASLSVGATDVSLWTVASKVLSGEQLTLLEHTVFFDIRLPRTALGVVVGAGLAVSGVLMQGLFRNPLADPGLVGVSAGATFGAVAAIVLGGMLPVAVSTWVGAALIPTAAFVGAWVSMTVLYRVATRNGRTSVATMLLGGIAIGALVMAAVGMMVYVADDLQLRELTFWQLGSLTGASWPKLVFAMPAILIACGVGYYLAHGLNGLSLGEATAGHMGVNVQALKRVTILATAAATGAAVAVSGGIGFVGIVVPHLLRLATGPDHRPLLLNAALLGGALLLGADMIARVIVAPAELPIGIITALLGAPVFLWILLRNRAIVDL